MADLEAIRRGIAAELRTVLPADEGHVSPYFAETPPMPCLQVVGVGDMERIDFADGKRFEIVVEAVLGLVSDKAAQRRLDGWLESNAVDGQIEDANTPTGALTSRLLEDGTVQTGQAVACDSIALESYGGPSRIRRDNAEFLVATWTFEVLT